MNGCDPATHGTAKGHPERVRLSVNPVTTPILLRRITEKQADQAEVMAVMKEADKLTINKKSDGNRLILSLEGRLNTANASELGTLLSGSLDGITDLVFDFSELEYISSAGLRVLLSTQKRMNSRGSMKITGASSNIIEIFDITGFTDFFTIESRS